MSFPVCHEKIIITLVCYKNGLSAHKITVKVASEMTLEKMTFFKKIEMYFSTTARNEKMKGLGLFVVRMLLVGQVDEGLDASFLKLA
jgi:hypothetical protein